MEVVETENLEMEQWEKLKNLLEVPEEIVVPVEFSLREFHGINVYRDCQFYFVELDAQRRFHFGLRIMVDSENSRKK